MEEWIRRMNTIWDSVGLRQEESKMILSLKLGELRKAPRFIKADCFLPKMGLIRVKSLLQSHFLRKETKG